MPCGGRDRRLGSLDRSWPTSSRSRSRTVPSARSRPAPPPASWPPTIGKRPAQGGGDRRRQRRRARPRAGRWPTATRSRSSRADSDRGLFTIRHSTAHVLAQAVLDLFPGATFGIGPPVEDGFYYDFELPERGGTFTPDDLERIDARMREIIAEEQPFVRDEIAGRRGPGRCSRTTRTSSRSSTTPRPTRCRRRSRASSAPTRTRRGSSTCAAARTSSTRAATSATSS